ncbi:tyrosine-type recombinase/integrase [Propionibacterium australiense]|uniref:Integrase, catalytic domain n=1 Tax=Propionibacterium australiense TaxID=119981 RepID=A0A383S798_9ACTN|nr:site-specific integrase [Propionibacterium australiense]RLP10931.1 site-specific integrase [Propionibacterium australiense]SYZ33885.1 Integrase, catalytic domain [Propionibacterium australiense]VEH90880.1 site-specific tyrosine recombinase XerC [Propionibacterium australiense]
MSATTWQLDEPREGGSGSAPSLHLLPATQMSHRLDSYLHVWLATRAGTVADKTLRTDQDLLRLIPQSCLSQDPRALTQPAVSRLLAHFRSRGLSELSVRRYRASLSSFFSWLRNQGVIDSSPMPQQSSDQPARQTTTAMPFTAAELHAAFRLWQARDRRLALVMLVLAHTGLRWAEARALLVSDVHLREGRLIVRRSMPEGVSTREFSPELIRRVPLSKCATRALAELTAGARPDQLAMTTDRGCQLHRTSVLRALDWPHTGQGRRLVDLRHTAAQLWLDCGHSPAQVRGWMGHSLITG